MNLTEPEVFARIKGTHVQIVRIEGTFVVVLDVSFRDDIRLSCAWERSSKIDPDSVSKWARGRIMKRFQVGIMMLEGSDPSLFIGCNTKLLRAFRSRCRIKDDGFIIDETRTNLSMSAGTEPFLEP